jgi:hypothetical protein
MQYKASAHYDLVQPLHEMNKHRSMKENNLTYNHWWLATYWKTAKAHHFRQNFFVINIWETEKMMQCQPFLFIKYETVIN